MSRLLLGAGFACLVATSASATGFQIPPLPDFELLREAGEIAAARAEAQPRQQIAIKRLARQQRGMIAVPASPG